MPNSANSTIPVIAASQVYLPSNEDFLLFFNTENLLHLTGAKNVLNVLTFIDYELGGGGTGLNGTTNFIAKFTPDGQHAGDSQLYDNGVNLVGNIVGALSFNVGGNSGEFITGSKSVSVNGDATEFITGDKTVLVNGNATEFITGDKTVSVNGNASEVINVNKTVSVNGDTIELITGSKSVSINTDLTEIISGDKSNSVGSNLIETVGGNKAETIGGNDSLNISGLLAIQVGTNELKNIIGNKSEAIGGNENRIITGTELRQTNNITTAIDLATGNILTQEYKQVGGSIAALFAFPNTLAGSCKIRAVGAAANPALNEGAVIDIELQFANGSLSNIATVSVIKTPASLGSGASVINDTNVSATATVTDSLGGNFIWLVKKELLIIAH